MCWTPVRLHLRGLNCLPRLCRSPRAMETVNNNVHALRCAASLEPAQCRWSRACMKKKTRDVCFKSVLFVVFVCLHHPPLFKQLSSIASRLICSMFSFEVDEVRYNTVVVYSRQCFSGCALHKLLALYVVVRCRELGLVSKVCNVMRFELVRKRETRTSVTNHVSLLTHGWERSRGHLSSWFTFSE